MLEKARPSGACGNLTGYELVEDHVYKNEGYKDLAPAYTICKDADGLFWKLEWHYGSGEHQYFNHEIT